MGFCIRQIQHNNTYMYFIHDHDEKFKKHSTSATISGIALSQLRLDFAMRCLSEVNLSNDNSVLLSF